MVVLKQFTMRVGAVAQVCAAQPDMAIMCCCSPNLGLVIPTMALEGHGTANMTGNIIPREMAVISKLRESGEDAFASRAAWLGNLDRLHFAYSAVNPVAIKPLMHAIGLPAGPLRKPLQPMTGAALQKGLDALVKSGAAQPYGFRVDNTSIAA